MAGADTDARLAGRYELGEVIGRGGMGEVRAGTDHRLGRPVAVKLLRADLADDPEVRVRFEAEARAAAQLSHPNVVAVFDTGEEDGRPFIVMERLPGDTLADEIARAPLAPDSARRAGAQMLAALQVAHDAGICHRDVKPGNVLRAHDDVWKVADFGIAKSTEAAVDLTATGGLIGTPAYLAPERIEGRAATPASDLYSAGVVLYEALSGHKPFEADTPVAVAQMVLDRAPEPLRSLSPDLDPALVGTIERAMDKDPARRFSNAADMARGLTGDTEPVTQPRAPAPTRGTQVLPSPPRPRKRIPVGWWVVAAAAAVIGVAVGVAVLRDSDSPSVVPAETTPTTAAVAGGGASGPPLPASLDDALEQLEESVRP
ncbi:MAG: serine/threonine protein kinase [Actinobacteria bacterium]|nr:serine/threonine protein kinase [Actinomycetota bacterium]